MGIMLELQSNYTHLIRTPHNGQFVLSLGKKHPYIISQFNLLNRLNTDTPLIRTLSMASSVSILTVFDCL